jgi:hypothetical protein
MSRAPRARAAAARARARSQLLAGVVSWPGRKRRGHAPMCLENAIGTAGTFRALHPLISAGNQVYLIASRSKAAPRPSWCKESAVAISLGKRPLSRCPVRLPFWRQIELSALHLLAKFVQSLDSFEQSAQCPRHVLERQKVAMDAARCHHR